MALCPQCGVENRTENYKCIECGKLLTSRPLIRGQYKMTKPYIFSSFRAVYEAEDTQNNDNIVSVREFLPHRINPGDTMLTHSTFEALMNQYSKLKHPNLAGIIDYFTEGNYFFAVYEYINGLDMTKYLSHHQIIRGTGYPEELLSNWILSMCNLVEYLHHSFQKPVFLNDLKPAGVVFNQDNEELVFIDIGLSKLLALLGPHYLITEDIQTFKKAGKNFDTIGWDLFCLGNLMHYLLTGIDLLQISENSRIPLNVTRPDLSQNMIDIVNRLLGENYQSGYNDIRELKNDLLLKTNRLPLRAFYFYPDFIKDETDFDESEWPMFLGNEARTGSVGLSPRVPIKLKWTAKLKSSKNAFLSTSGDYVYVVTKEGLIYAVDIINGKIHWKSNLRRKITTPCITYQDSVYFVTSNRELIALDYGEQEYKWQQEFESPAMASPLIHDEIIYVPLYNGSVYAVNSDNGEILTSFKIEGNILSSPLVYDGRLFVTSLNKLICAIDIETGQILWQFDSDAGFSSSPTISENTLFTGSLDGTVSAINIDTGNVLWQHNFRGAITQSVKAIPEHVFFITQAGNLYALKSNKGNVIWSKDLGASDYEYPFAISMDTMFLVDKKNTLRTMNSFTGETRHKLHMSHPPVSQLMIAHKQLYMVSTTGHLVAFGK
jgi:outer membrane protein assembly factor BamB